MKWKDTGNEESKDPENIDAYYEDDGYTALQNNGLKKTSILSGNPVRYLYWGLGVAAIVGIVLLVLLLFSNLNEPSNLSRINELEQKVQKLEQRLETYEGVDEKITRIWEQAKSFEKFKTRFDRSEASMSLRMDHLASSLDALQKKTDNTLNKFERLSKKAAPPPTTVKKSIEKKKRTGRVHTVATGDTLFSISRRYNLTVQTLKSINQLPEGAAIQVGQKLKVDRPGN